MKRVCIKVISMMMLSLLILLASFGLVREKEVKEGKEMPDFTVDYIDYGQYLRKIWVSDEAINGKERAYSLIITKIGERLIEGKIAITSGRAYSYFQESEDPAFVKRFKGEISGREAECRIYDKTDCIGDIKIVFESSHRITSRIELRDEIPYKLPYDYTEQLLEKTYLLKPYHLTDWDMIKNEKLSFPVNFKLWGEVNFVSCVVMSGNKSYPTAFLTDHEENILYHFEGDYLTDTEIVDVTIEDYNGDGLKDVRMITCFPGFLEEDCMEWLFLQRKNGMFDKALKRWIC